MPPGVPMLGSTSTRMAGLGRREAGADLLQRGERDAGPADANDRGVGQGRLCGAERQRQGDAPMKRARTRKSVVHRYLCLKDENHPPLIGSY